MWNRLVMHPSCQRWLKLCAGTVIVLHCILLHVFTTAVPWHSTRDSTRNNTKLDGNDLHTPIGTHRKHFIVTRKLNWLDAIDACQQLCANIASLPTLKDAEALSKALSALTKFQPDYFTVINKYDLNAGRRYWIGLNDLGTEGKWMWSGSGEELKYDFWFPNQPDHLNLPAKNGTYEHCVSLWDPLFHMQRNYKFNDEPCLMEYYVICNEPKESAKVRKKKNCLVF